MSSALLSIGTSRLLVVGPAAGAAVFALLVATSRGPASSRGHDAPPDEPPSVQESGPPAVAPAPVQRVETAADDGRSGGPLAVPLATIPREGPARPAAAADPAASGASLAATPPVTVVSAPEQQPSRSEVDAMEQQLARARADAQLQLQQDLNDQIAAIRLLVAQDQARREADAAAAQEDVARKESAVNMLLVAEGRLRTGDSDVLEMLDGASPALSYPAQSAAQRARSALESEDLYVARYWLAVAIAETQHVLLGR